MSAASASLVAAAKDRPSQAVNEGIFVSAQEQEAADFSD